MQTSKPGRTRAARRVSFFASLIGAFSFILALVLALLMFQLQGNPGFLLLWLLAAAGMAAYTRLNRKWRAMFERIYAMNPAKTVFAARKNWKWNVEDVAFREMPQESISYLLGQ